MADGTAWCGRYTVNVESQRGSIPLSVASYGIDGTMSPYQSRISGVNWSDTIV